MFAKHKSKLYLLFATLLVVMLVAGCVGRDTSTGQVKEVKIGNILPLSGAAAPLGKIGKEAREMAVEEINAAGGIKSLGGAKIKMIFADSKGDPATGVAEAERLITQEKVALITGTYQSGVALPATEVAERYKVPFFCPVPSEDVITERGFKYVFRLAEKTSWRNRDQVKFIQDMANKYGTPVKTVALIYEDTAWGQGAARGWEKYLGEAGLQIVLKEPYPRNSSDLTPVVLKVKQKKPDIILLCSYVSDAALLTNTFAEHKVKPVAFIGTSGGFADPVYFDTAGDNCEYFFDISTWEPDVNRPFSKEVNEKFKQKYGYGMNAEAVKAYVSMYVIKDALERAGSLDPEAIRKALAETHLTSGVTQMYASEIAFDETGQMVNAPLVISQFRKVNGKMERVTVWPEKDARPGWKPEWPFPGWEGR
ncbi:ABC transporter substrate-binding protein [Desulfofundulus salinus]|uniref:ABC transporter substrate-binding protein n=1 Tax=Desulfofundulus salinus TaxID=2419843 RepID=A0A494WWH8_9FIRM|nr:ABC transporter substrate-binding protein [Desulfofundulus salinum]RKO67898.1 ABC transporter substrate-binding protein [Desulfofundulus salinum]